MIERLDVETFFRARERLISASRIGIVCARSTVSLGQFFQFYLHLLGKDVVLFTGDPRMIDLLQRFGPGDVMVGIGFSRYAHWTVEHLRYAKKRGTWIMAITDYPSSPLAPLADESFFTPTGIPSHMDSFVAPLSFLTGLLRAVSNRLSKQTAEILHEMEDLWEQFGIYEPPSSV
ncbi:MurR/RpiR family transcriptional regulator [Kyrpidia sp.]|nr:MurR/RpiR family transcriptional regulator [Kyrpidia sp.]MCL6577659.1 MurR/RpiR family transcriptional regulator [Kyrpidia sp.]